MNTSETVYLLMPPVLAALLLAFAPSARRTKPLHAAGYVAVMGAAISGIVLGLAWFAKLRVIWTEVLIVLWFAIAWRLAWEVWRRITPWVAERCIAPTGDGENQQAVRRRAIARSAICFSLTLLVFLPLMLGAVITHRFKFGDGVSPADFGYSPFEHVVFQTSDDHNITAWYIPGRNADATVIICHGAGANKGNFLPFVTVFHDHGFNTLIFDFRGHGESDGHTTTFGLLEAREVIAAARWVRANHPQASKHLFGIGSSMGAAAMIHAAAQGAPFDGLVIDSCYSSVRDMADHHLGRAGPPGRLWGRLLLESCRRQSIATFTEFDLAPMVADLSATPLLFIHSPDDLGIPPAQSRRLFDAATTDRKEYWLAGGPHSNMVNADFDAYQEKVIGFLKSIETSANSHADTLRPNAAAP